MKKLLSVSVLVFLIKLAVAQTWTGPAGVTAGQVASYTFTNTIFYSMYSWTVTGGNVTSQSQNGTTYSCTVTWTTVGTGAVNFIGGGSQRGSYSVTVSCPTLATPTATFAYPNGTTICGSGSITYTGGPPTGVLWYWQTTTTGTSKSNSSTSFPVSGSGTYYLRANCGSSWSAAKATNAITVKTVPVVTAVTSPNCSGTSGGVVLTNNMAATTDTWTSTSSNVTGNSNSSGVSSSSSPYNFYLNETLTNNSNVNGTVTYTVTPSNNGCTGSSIQITTTVYPRPSVSFPVSSQNICSGSVASATLTTNGVSGATYTWSYSGHTAISGASAPPSNATSFSQTLTSIAGAPVAGTYQVTASANGCSGVTQPSVTFNVNPVPLISLTNNSPTICSGSSTNISFWSFVSNATFTWTVSPSNLTGSLGQGTPVSTGTVIQALVTPNAASAGNAVYNFQSVASFANGGSCSASNSSTVNVNPVPSISGANQTICSGSQAAINLSTNGVSGASYAWTVTQTNATGATTPASNATSTSPVLTATGNTPGTVNYSIVPSAPGCTGTTLNLVVNVNPVPTTSLNNALPVVCSGVPTNIAFSSSVTGATFTWTASSSNASGSSPQNVGVSAGTISQPLFSQDGVTPGSVSYNVTATGSYANGGVCTSTGNTIVAVNPRPVANPSNTTYFSGTPVSVGLSSNIGSSVFNYIVSGASNISNASSGAITPITQALSITDGINPGSVTYTVTPTAYGCAGTIANVVVNIYPTPILTSSAARVYMGSSATLTAQGFYDAYNWTSTSGPISGGNSIVVSKADTYNLTVVKGGATATTAFTVGSQFSGQDMNTFISNTLQVATSDTSRIKLMPVDSVRQGIQYFDGHGRLSQTISTQGSPSKSDVVQVAIYDGLGREAKKYLPFTSGNDGLFKGDPVGAISNNYLQSAQYSFYNMNLHAKMTGDTRPFSERVFETSDLNRPTFDYGPGTNWNNTTNQNPVAHQYLVNQAGEVLLFTYDLTSGLVSTASGGAGFYAAGQLTVNKTIDEHKNEVIQYVDKLERTVCKKVQYKTDGSGNKLYASTYYIYDDYGSLVVVLPPQAVKSALATLTKN